jgi:hypothetical protein
MRISQSGNLTAALGDIPLARQQPLNRNILVQRLPMDAPRAEFVFIALGWGAGKQAREPCQWHAERAPIIQRDPQIVLIAGDYLRI